MPEGTGGAVAGGGWAGELTKDGAGRQLKLKEKGGRGLEDDGGQSVSGQGAGGGVPKDMANYQSNEAADAKQVAEQLNEDALKNRYSHLILVADPITLGRIRPLLHKETQARLLDDLAKNFTNAPLEDIQRARAA